jgi:aquaporin Z
MLRPLREHWPEYLFEALALAIFMVSAGVFTTLLEYPTSPLHQALPGAFLRRTFTGVAMRVTAIGLIYSPMGQRSGAHMNPGVTLTFLRLGKIKGLDALFYVGAQFVGGIAGVLAVAVCIRYILGDRSVNYVATLPGAPGELVAWIAEFDIAFVLMLVVLLVSNTPRLARWTGVFAGAGWIALGRAVDLLHRTGAGDAARGGRLSELGGRFEIIVDVGTDKPIEPSSADK